mgnify:CR=1 FL=1
MNKYIEKLPIWARRVLALPLALIAYIIVNTLCFLVVPKAYSTANLYRMNSEWIMQNTPGIVFSYSFSFLLSIAVFMYVLCCIVPAKKYAASLVAAITWSVFFLFGYSINSRIIPEALPAFAIAYLLSILFLIWFTLRLRKTSNIKEADECIKGE